MASRLFSACCGLALCLFLAGPATGDEKTTSADEYRKQYAQVKQVTVELPSGAVFKIKSFDQRRLNRLLSMMGISFLEYENLLRKNFEKMSPREVGKHMDLWNAIIVQSVIEPPMCIEPEEGKLEVELLTAADTDRLQEEIIKLAEETSLPIKPLSSAPPRTDIPEITVSKLLMNPEKYEDKLIDTSGSVEKELPDIGILSRQGKSVTLQRFYLSDGKASILVLRFFTKGERFFSESIIRDLMGKGDDVMMANIDDGKFTAKLIAEPVIITQSRNIERIEKQWINIALQSMH